MQTENDDSKQDSSARKYKHKSFVRLLYHKNIRLIYGNAQNKQKCYKTVQVYWRLYKITVSQFKLDGWCASTKNNKLNFYRTYYYYTQGAVLLLAITFHWASHKRNITRAIWAGICMWLDCDLSFDEISNMHLNQHLLYNVVKH